MKEKIKEILEIYKNNKNFIENSPGEFIKLLRSELNIFICIKPEAYKSGINFLVQILTPDLESPTLYNEKLTTGCYGDNAEFASFEKAEIFGINKVIELLYGI